MLQLILVGDGYREEDEAVFHRHAGELVSAIKRESWFEPGLLGIRTHFVASKDSGKWVSPGRGPRNTAFKFELGKDGAVARLISGDDESVREAVRDVVAGMEAFHVGVLCNSRRYGGWGGPRGEMFWVCAGAFNWVDTGLHEMGHSLFNLRDEYSDDTGQRRRWPEEWPDPEQPNVTKDPTGRKWAHITDTVFEGAARYDLGIYRPFERCRMRVRGPFCPVCEDAARRTLEEFLVEAPEPVEEDPLVDSAMHGDDGSVTPTGTDARGKIAIQTGRDVKVFTDDSGGAMEAVHFLLRRQFGGES